LNLPQALEKTSRLQIGWRGRGEETIPHKVLIEIVGVEKIYGDPLAGHRALEPVTLSVREREFFTLLGPSGCGKTT
jgi:ABC-type glutathione transport system ATPase component